MACAAPWAHTSWPACPRAASCRRYRRPRRRSRSACRASNPRRTLCPIGCFARQKPAHERFVHDGNRTAAHAVAGLEVPAAPQRDAHRLEPAWRRGVQPERGPDAGHRSIADGDHAGARTAPGEQPYRRDRRRSDAWNGRRRIAQTLDARTALLGRPATRLEVQFRHEQWLWHEAERQLVERRKRVKEQSGCDDQRE